MLESKHKALNAFLSSNGVVHTEGNTGQFPAVYPAIRKFLKEQDVKTIFEIGFNAGHSSMFFLESGINVISLDIGIHDYVVTAKEFIDKEYPEKHRLIIGDSNIKLPEIIKSEGITCDLIFIDGDHEFDTAIKDLEHGKKIASLVIVDDVIFNPDNQQAWNIGPTQAWSKAVQDGLVIELGNIQGSDYGVVWGKYLN